MRLPPDAVATRGSSAVPHVAPGKATRELTVRLPARKRVGRSAAHCGDRAARLRRVMPPFTYARRVGVLPSERGRRHA